MEESENGRFLRTVLRKDVYERLEKFAQDYTTGMGKWDFGVAIQLLLDFHEQHSNVAQINAKLDVLLSQVFSEVPEQPKDDIPKEDTSTEMLGGERLK